jgi:nucleotide-binding universal stress UspA family protein
MHADQRSETSNVDVDGLGDQIAETAASIDAATHQLLTQIRQFDACGGWHRHGALSCAHWLNWRIGLNLGAAREKVRVGNALASLPLIDDALKRGEVSYSKVRAMTRVATPQTEAELLEMARHSTAAQLEKICRYYRQATDVCGEQARAREDLRWVTERSTDDGMVAITIRVHPDEAATVMEAIRVSAETSGGELADGAVAMAADVLRGDAVDRAPVDVSLHVSAETLQGHFDDGTGVSAETCKRLCCDAGIAVIVDGVDGIDGVDGVEHGGTTMSVGRKTRTIPAPIKRALRARDAGCRFPGCTNTRHVDGHHIQHWADGGHTELSNIISLCRRHHRYVHELGFGIAMRDGGCDGGEPVFVDPTGAPIPAAGVVKPACYDVIKRFERPAQTNLPRWDGTPPDYALAVDALLQVAAS